MKRKKTLRKTRLTSKIYCTLTVVTSLLISPSFFLGIVERANTQARARLASHRAWQFSRSLNRTLVSFRSDVFCNHSWFAMSFSGSNSRQSRFTYDYWGLKVSEAPAPGLWTRASNCKNSNHNMRSLSNYMCIHYFFKFILDFWNKLKCTKGVKSENVSVHAKLNSFGKFDTKLLSWKLRKLIYNYFRFTRRYHAISISLSSEKGWKNVCMRTW